MDLRKMNDRQKIEITVKPLVKVGRTVSGAVWFFYFSVSVPLKKKRVARLKIWHRENRRKCCQINRLKKVFD